MSGQSVVKEVLREYEKDRDNAERERRVRVERAYNAVPRLRAIDEELSGLGLSIARRIANGEGGDIVPLLREKNEALSEERKILIEEGGFGGGYFDDVYKCSVCRDTGFVGNSRCACFGLRMIKKLYDLSNIKNVLSKENFDTFDMNYYSNETDPKTGVSPRAKMNSIWTTALDFVRDFDSVFNNLLMYGETGLGKTFLCNCIAKDLLDKGKTVMYTTSPKLFKTVEELRFNRSEEEDSSERMIELVYDADLLIIDDLGTEIVTSVIASELFNIINSRLLSQRHTIISTNVPPSDYEEIYSSRITSRLFGNYKFLKFIGDDIRLKIRYNM